MADAEKMELVDRLKEAFKHGREYGEFIRGIARNSDEERALEYEWRRGCDIDRDDPEKMDAEERLKMSYELGRVYGEFAKKYDCDPDEDTKTALREYIMENGYGDSLPFNPSFMTGTAEFERKTTQEWKRGFIDGYENAQVVLVPCEERLQRKRQQRAKHKRAYEHGRECGEHVRKFCYDPDKDTKTAMREYVKSADDSYRAFMCDGWELGFIDGYESIQEEES